MLVNLLTSSNFQRSWCRHLQVLVGSNAYLLSSRVKSRSCSLALSISSRKKDGIFTLCPAQCQKVLSIHHSQQSQMDTLHASFARP